MCHVHVNFTIDMFVFRIRHWEFKSHRNKLYDIIAPKVCGQSQRNNEEIYLFSSNDLALTLVAFCQIVSFV